MFMSMKYGGWHVAITFKYCDYPYLDQNRCYERDEGLDSSELPVTYVTKEAYMRISNDASINLFADPISRFRYPLMQLTSTC